MKAAVGDLVQAGQVLFTLDTTDLIQAVQVAQRALSEDLGLDLPQRQGSGTGEEAEAGGFQCPEGIGGGGGPGFGMRAGEIENIWLIEALIELLQNKQDFYACLPTRQSKLFSILA